MDWPLEIAQVCWLLFQLYYNTCTRYAAVLCGYKGSLVHTGAAVVN